MPYYTNNTFIMIKQYNNTSFEKYTYLHNEATEATGKKIPK